MENYYVRAETYDRQKLEQFCHNWEIKGIVLGDLLCQRRMFRNGTLEMVDMMRDIAKAGKEPVYQLPLYVTSRNWDEVTSVILFLSDLQCRASVIVQDFGIAEMIHRDMPDIALIWGQMGRNRCGKFSDVFLEFLCEQGFTGMETTDRSLIKRLTQFHLQPYVGNAVFSYRSVGRNCYLRYQTGFCDPVLCRNGTLTMSAEDRSLCFSIDGYLLGKKLEFLSEEQFFSLCECSAVIPIRYYN